MNFKFFDRSFQFTLLWCILGVSVSKADTVKASDFGYNKENATEAFQKAIRSANDTIIVDLQENPWNVDPSWFNNLRDKTIIFESGVILQQRKGAFNGKLDMLFRLEKSTNITIIGYGATFKMDRESLGRLGSEFRNSIALYDCSHITIKGLRVEESGGDGLLISSRSPYGYCSDIAIKDIVFSNHLRQGMSIVSLQGGLFENCVFQGTSGRFPGAGVDLEPNYPAQCLIGITFKNCSFIDNAQAGILFALTKTNGDSSPLEVAFYDSYIAGNNKENVPRNKQGSYWGGEIQIGMNKDFNHPQKGSVLFKRTIVENFPKYAFMTKKTENAFLVTFEDLAIYNTARFRDNKIIPIQIQRYNYRKKEPAAGGIHFRNLLVDAGQGKKSISLSGDSWFDWKLKNFSVTGTFVSKFADVIQDRNKKLNFEGNAQDSVHVKYHAHSALPRTSVTITKTSEASQCTFTRKSKDIGYPLIVSLEFLRMGDEMPVLLKKMILPSGKEKVTVPLDQLLPATHPENLGAGEINIVKAAHYTLGKHARLKIGP
ncbi:right-handed parallel beta-helix repeat-containing protein [Spongiimicrobium salis]|uniref:right-handed parallel beta-helix repeat-containing protein n=1 Tax=Spongiimicrobium salis TaxID=1667022 RepID=UPI00374C90A2